MLLLAILIEHFDEESLREESTKGQQSIINISLSKYFKNKTKNCCVTCRKKIE